MINIFLPVVLCFFVISTSLAQETRFPVRVQTSATVTSSFYSSSGIAARQPQNMQYGIIRTSVSLFEMVELPFEFYFSTKQTQFQQPFNQFGVSPRISNWLTLHGGYFSTRISDFTFGDVRIFGGGVEVTPGDFRFKALYGRTRKAIEPDRVSYSPEVYKQMAYAFSIGYGALSESYFNINIFHAVDDSTSVISDSALTKPQENLVGSIDFGTRFGEIVTLDGEVGISLFSSNIAADTFDTGIRIPKFLFTPNSSTRLDGAAKLNCTITPSRVLSFTLSSRWVGPGFMTLGYGLMPNDLLEFAVGPRLRLLENKLLIRSKLGIRYNNLRQTKSSTTSRFTGMLGASWQIDNNIGIDASYNRNQIDSRHKNDTLRLSNVFNAFSFSPRITFDAFDGINNLLVTYNYQNALDKNVYTSSLSDSRTHSINCTHILQFPSTLSLTTLCLYTKSVMSSASAQIIHTSETVGKQFFDKTVNASLSIGVNVVQTTQTSNQFVFRLSATYNLKDYGSFTCHITNNAFRGDGIVQKNYNELYGTLQYAINL